MMKDLPIEDLDFISEKASESFDRLHNKKIFLTGGTGLFGKWIVAGLLHSQKNIHLTILSRDPERFQKEFPLASGCNFIKGDVRSFIFPNEKYDYIIHAATEASAKLNNEDPKLMLETIIEGQRRIQDFAVHCHAKEILFTSSGAIYGKIPSDVERVHEDFWWDESELIPYSAYADGKRKTEEMGCIFSNETKIKFKIARCFAFVGPCLPLNTHFAIGNFIKNGIDGNKIIVKGDGTPTRSYLYMADLVVWLLRILTHGESSRPYNVGSDEFLSVGELAKKISSFFSTSSVEILKSPVPGQVIERYVPSCERVRKELGLQVWTKLDDAIRKTIDWYNN